MKKDSVERQKYTYFSYTLFVRLGVFLLLSIIFITSSEAWVDIAICKSGSGANPPSCMPPQPRPGVPLPTIYNFLSETWSTGSSHTRNYYSAYYCCKQHACNGAGQWDNYFNDYRAMGSEEGMSGIWYYRVTQRDNIDLGGGLQDNGLITAFYCHPTCKYYWGGSLYNYEAGSKVSRSDNNALDWSCTSDGSTCKHCDGSGNCVFDCTSADGVCCDPSTGCPRANGYDIGHCQICDGTHYYAVNVAAGSDPDDDCSDGVCTTGYCNGAGACGYTQWLEDGCPACQLCNGAGACTSYYEGIKDTDGSNWCSYGCSYCSSGSCVGNCNQGDCCNTTTRCYQPTSYNPGTTCKKCTGTQSTSVFQTSNEDLWGQCTSTTANCYSDNCNGTSAACGYDAAWSYPNSPSHCTYCTGSSYSVSTNSTTAGQARTCYSASATQPLSVAEPSICRNGTQTVDSNCNWGTCVGSIGPSTESSGGGACTDTMVNTGLCSDGLDNDCDLYLDWDSQTWSSCVADGISVQNKHGDEGCAVSVTKLYTVGISGGNNLCYNDSYYVNCTSSVKDVNSIVLFKSTRPLSVYNKTAVRLATGDITSGEKYLYVNYTIPTAPAGTTLYGANWTVKHGNLTIYNITFINEGIIDYSSADNLHKCWDTATTYFDRKTIQLRIVSNFNDGTSKSQCLYKDPSLGFVWGNIGTTSTSPATITYWDRQQKCFTPNSIDTNLSRLYDYNFSTSAGITLKVDPAISPYYFYFWYANTSNEFNISCGYMQIYEEGMNWIYLTDVDEYCTFDRWHDSSWGGFNATFRCNLAALGPKNLTCMINQSRSFQSGSNQTKSINVVNCTATNEICDGNDNDFDGFIDEDNVCCGTANGTVVYLVPASGLCHSEYAVPTVRSYVDTYNWTCPATVAGGNYSNCSASREYKLTVSKIYHYTHEGEMLGTDISSDPSGISCSSLYSYYLNPSTCSYFLNPRQSVTLTTQLPANCIMSWTGCDSSSGNTCSASMMSDKSITAEYWADPFLKIEIEGIGKGSITSSEGATGDSSVIYCTSTTTPCSNTFTHGSSVTLTAAALEDDSYFAGWIYDTAGVCSGSGSTCSIAMNTYGRTIKAQFNYILATFVETTGLSEVITAPTVLNYYLNRNISDDISVVPIKNLPYFEINGSYFYLANSSVLEPGRGCSDSFTSKAENTYCTLKNKTYAECNISLNSSFNYFDRTMVFYGCAKINTTWNVSVAEYLNVTSSCGDGKISGNEQCEPFGSSYYCSLYPQQCSLNCINPGTIGQCNCNSGYVNKSGKCYPWFVRTVGLSESRNYPSIDTYSENKIISDNISLFIPPDYMGSGGEITEHGLDDNYYYLTSVNSCNDYGYTYHQTPAGTSTYCVKINRTLVACNITLQSSFTNFDSIITFYGCAKVGSSWKATPAEYLKISTSCGDGKLSGSEQCDPALSPNCISSEDSECTCEPGYFSDSGTCVRIYANTTGLSEVSTLPTYKNYLDNKDIRDDIQVTVLNGVGYSIASESVYLADSDVLTLGCTDDFAAEAENTACTKTDATNAECHITLGDGFSYFDSPMVYYGCVKVGSGSSQWYMTPAEYLIIQSLCGDGKLSGGEQCDYSISGVNNCMDSGDGIENQCKCEQGYFNVSGTCIKVYANTTPLSEIITSPTYDTYSENKKIEDNIIVTIENNDPNYGIDGENAYLAASDALTLGCGQALAADNTECDVVDDTTAECEITLDSSFNYFDNIMVYYGCVKVTNVSGSVWHRTPAEYLVIQSECGDGKVSGGETCEPSFAAHCNDADSASPCTCEEGYDADSGYCSKIYINTTDLSEIEALPTYRTYSHNQNISDNISATIINYEHMGYMIEGEDYYLGTSYTGVIGCNQNHEGEDPDSNCVKKNNTYVNCNITLKEDTFNAFDTTLKYYGCAKINGEWRISPPEYLVVQSSCGDGKLSGDEQCDHAISGVNNCVVLGADKCKCEQGFFNVSGTCIRIYANTKGLSEDSSSPTPITYLLNKEIDDDISVTIINNIGYEIDGTNFYLANSNAATTGCGGTSGAFTNEADNTDCIRTNEKYADCWITLDSNFNYFDKDMVYYGCVKIISPSGVSAWNITPAEYMIVPTTCGDGKVSGEEQCEPSLGTNCIPPGQQGACNCESGFFNHSGRCIYWYVNTTGLSERELLPTIVTYSADKKIEDNISVTFFNNGGFPYSLNSSYFYLANSNVLATGCNDAYDSRAGYSSEGFSTLCRRVNETYAACNITLLNTFNKFDELIKLYGCAKINTTWNISVAEYLNVTTSCGDGKLSGNEQCDYSISGISDCVSTGADADKCKCEAGYFNVSGTCVKVYANTTGLSEVQSAPTDDTYSENKIIQDDIEVTIRNNAPGYEIDGNNFYLAASSAVTLGCRDDFAVGGYKADNTVCTRRDTKNVDCEITLDSSFNYFDQAMVYYGCVKVTNVSGSVWHRTPAEYLVIRSQCGDNKLSGSEQCEPSWGEHCMDSGDGIANQCKCEQGYFNVSGICVKVYVNTTGLSEVQSNPTYDTYSENKEIADDISVTIINNAPGYGIDGNNFYLANSNAATTGCTDAKASEADNTVCTKRDSINVDCTITLDSSFNYFDQKMVYYGCVKVTNVSGSVWHRTPAEYLIIQSQCGDRKVSGEEQCDYLASGVSNCVSIGADKCKCEAGFFNVSGTCVKVYANTTGLPEDRTARESITYSLNREIDDNISVTIVNNVGYGIDEDNFYLANSGVLTTGCKDERASKADNTVCVKRNNTYADCKITLDSSFDYFDREIAYYGCVKVTNVSGARWHRTPAEYMIVPTTCGDGKRSGNEQCDYLASGVYNCVSTGADADKCKCENGYFNVSGKCIRIYSNTTGLSENSNTRTSVTYSLNKEIDDDISVTIINNIGYAIDGDNFYLANSNAATTGCGGTIDAFTNEADNTDCVKINDSYADCKITLDSSFDYFDREMVYYGCVKIISPSGVSAWNITPAEYMIVPTTCGDGKVSGEGEEEEECEPSLEANCQPVDHPQECMCKPGHFAKDGRCIGWSINTTGLSEDSSRITKVNYSVKKNISDNISVTIEANSGYALDNIYFYIGNSYTVASGCADSFATKADNTRCVRKNNTYAICNITLESDFNYFDQEIVYYGCAKVGGLWKYSIAEHLMVTTSCGDGKKSGTEVCDDGATNGLIPGGCNASCTGYVLNLCPEGTRACPDNTCRVSCDPERPCNNNGICEDTESCFCDDCDRKQDYCEENLRCREKLCSEEYCGNRIIEDDEECDDGNWNNMDGCINCALAYCGDGYIRYGYEQCDMGEENGNGVSGCTAVCLLSSNIIGKSLVMNYTSYNDNDQSGYASHVRFVLVGPDLVTPPARTVDNPLLSNMQTGYAGQSLLSTCLTVTSPGDTCIQLWFVNISRTYDREIYALSEDGGSSLVNLLNFTVEYNSPYFEGVNSDGDVANDDDDGENDDGENDGDGDIIYSPSFAIRIIPTIEGFVPLGSSVLRTRSNVTNFYNWTYLPYDTFEALSNDLTARGGYWTCIEGYHINDPVNRYNQTECIPDDATRNDYLNS